MALFPWRTTTDNTASGASCTASAAGSLVQSGGTSVAGCPAHNHVVSYPPGHIHSTGVYSYPNSNHITPSEQLLSLVRMRLRMDEGALFKFAHIHACTVGDKVHVLIINSEPVVLTDDANMFPSDQFITQIRLLGVGE